MDHQGMLHQFAEPLLQVLAEDIVPALNKLRQEKREASLHNESVVAVAEMKRRMSEHSWAFEQR